MKIEQAVEKFDVVFLRWFERGRPESDTELNQASRDIIKAMKKMGLDKETLDSLTTINTARLKAILKEEAERRGIDIRQPWSAGTPLEGKAGEYVAPRLRFTTSG